MCVATGKRLTFRRVPPPTLAALKVLVRVISERVGRALERQGLRVWDLENSFLMVDLPDGAGFDDLLGHSIYLPHCARPSSGPQGIYPAGITGRGVYRRQVSATGRLLVAHRGEEHRFSENPIDHWKYLKTKNMYCIIEPRAIASTN